MAVSAQGCAGGEREDRLAAAHANGDEDERTEVEVLEEDDEVSDKPVECYRSLS